jgi:hypothetical protein
MADSSKIKLRLYDCQFCGESLLDTREGVELHKIAHLLEQLLDQITRIADHLEYIRHRGLGR